MQAWCIKSCVRVTDFVLTQLYIEVNNFTQKVANVLYVQALSIISPAKMFKVTNNVLLAKLDQYLGKYLFVLFFDYM